MKTLRTSGNDEPVRKARRDAGALQEAVTKIAAGKRSFSHGLKKKNKDTNKHDFTPLDIENMTLLARGIFISRSI